ncbi:hypothetical protein [Achromobacter insolitus]|uniref:hypothetical protein n=1 Tax=Achromobacter insolitus TaxID=217204 RepID=UPI0007C23742|nr:hypothetical protein [Achromobacter insolitus]OAD16462.1 hypothetical protein A3839_28340 [Achromobacter insolitus]
MKNQNSRSPLGFAKLAMLCVLTAFSGALLSGCNDEKAAASDQGSGTDQAAIAKHNAELQRKNEVRNQIK